MEGVTFQYLEVATQYYELIDTFLGDFGSMFLEFLRIMGNTYILNMSSFFATRLPGYRKTGLTSVVMELLRILECT